MTRRSGPVRERAEAAATSERATTAAVTTGRVSKATEAARTASAPLKTAAQSCANSFTGDTPVLMADGTSKPIKDVTVGEKVLATDPETGQTAARPVAALIRHGGKHVMVDLTLADGSVLHATAGHPIWEATTARFTKAIDLHTGDQVLLPAGRRLALTGVRVHTENLTAYNLQIADIHTYYAGTTPTLTHNSCDSVAGVGHAGIHQFPAIKVGKSQFFDDQDLAALSNTDGVPGTMQKNSNIRYVLRGRVRWE